MAYAILVIGAVYAFFWLLSFLFSLKTTGQRSVVIPFAMLLLFGSVAGAGVFFLEQAPVEYLTVEKYTSLKSGMSKDEVKKTLGDEQVVNYSTLKSSLADESRKKIFDLSANNIQMPPEVRGRLPPGTFHAEREDARTKITIEGEASQVYNERPAVGEKEVSFVQLGMAASGDPDNRGVNGLKGLSLRFFVPDLEDEQTKLDNRKKAKEAFMENQAKLKAELKEINDKEAQARKTAEDKGKKYKPKKLSKDDQAKLDQLKVDAYASWKPAPLYINAKDGQEWFITEGVDWVYPEAELDENGKPVTYESFDDKNGDGIQDKGEKTIEATKYVDEDQAALALCMAMNFGEDNGQCREQPENPVAPAKKMSEQDKLKRFPFKVYRDIYEDPAQLIVTVTHPDFLGKDGNQIRVQTFHYTGKDSPKVMTKNESVRIGRFTDGESHSLRQGAHSASLEFWYEEDPILDEDFNSKPRMIVAGYVSEKLVCVGQFGLTLGEAKEPIPYVPAATKK